MSCTIEAKVNGPYLIRNLQSLTDPAGAEILPEKETVALCRCGQSGNKPFCDGTHSRIGFSSTTDIPKMGKRQNHDGKHITIHDNRRQCAHAGECTAGLPGVWRMGEEPWIDPDGGDVEKIIAVIERCPSGALAYSVMGKSGKLPAQSDGVAVTKNGPYQVRGAMTLNDSSRNTDDAPSHYALCRCGATKNKPFCDGSHWDINFDDSA